MSRPPLTPQTWPVLYADAELPPFLANRLWVDFREAGTTGPQYEARLDQLVRALRGRPVADRPARDGAVVWPAGAGGEVVRPAGPVQAELAVSAAEVSLSAGADYSIHFTGGVTFAITPRDLTVTPNTGQSKVYGDSDPTLTYMHGALYNGDTDSVFSGALSNFI